MKLLLHAEIVILLMISNVISGMVGFYVCKEGMKLVTCNPVEVQCVLKDYMFSKGNEILDVEERNGILDVEKICTRKFVIDGKEVSPEEYISISKKKCMKRFTQGLYR